ncbi:glycosyltransferase [Candidatus Omnitrophota bacterium]
MGCAEDGIKIYLLSFEKKQNLRDNKRVAWQNQELQKHNIHWVRLKYHSRWANVFDLFMGLAITNYLVLTKKIKVIHARASIPALIGFLTSRLWPVKFIYDRRGTMVGDFVDDVNKVNIFRHRIFSKLLNNLEQRILYSADSIIVLSEMMAGILRQGRLGKNGQGHNIKVIPCCVDLDRFNLSLNKDQGLLRKHGLQGKFIFLYLGSLGTCYKFREMLEFFKLAKTQIDNAHFLILTQTKKQIAEGLIAKYDFDSRDSTILNVEPKEVSKYIALSKAALIFIKQAYSNLASCPTKVAECLACGVPVIVSSVMGDVGAIVNENRIGVVVDDFSDSEYEIKIKQYLEIISQDDNLAQRCFQVAREKFPLKMGIGRYREVYNQIMEAKA